MFEVHAASLNGVVNCWRLGFSVGFQKYNRQSEGSCDIPWGSVVIHVGKIVSTIPKSWDDLIAGVLGMHSYWSLCAVPAAIQALQGHAAPCQGSWYFQEPPSTLTWPHLDFVLAGTSESFLQLIAVRI